MIYKVQMAQSGKDGMSFEQMGGWGFYHPTNVKSCYI